MPVRLASLMSKPNMPAGMVARTICQPRRAEGSGKWLPLQQSRQGGSDDLDQVAPEIGDDCHQRAKLHEHIKIESLLGGDFPTQEGRADDEVSGAGNGMNSVRPWMMPRMIA